jgi:hypothetical protein
MSEEGPNREGVRIKSSDISDGWDCIKLFEKVTRYSGRIVVETLNTSWEMKFIICRCVIVLISVLLGVCRQLRI